MDKGKTFSAILACYLPVILSELVNCKSAILIVKIKVLVTLSSILLDTFMFNSIAYNNSIVRVEISIDVITKGNFHSILSGHIALKRRGVCVIFFLRELFRKISKTIVDNRAINFNCNGCDIFGTK